MRQFLFVLFLLASLPAPAKAAPYAEYDPRTGDIFIRELRGVITASVRSSATLLRSSILDEPPEISPNDAAVPLVQNGSVAWFTNLSVAMPWNPPAARVPFAFDSIRLPSLVPPGTAVATLNAFYGVDASTRLPMSIVVVPEPSSSALLAMGIAGGIAVRLRGAEASSR
jgi:hypothetical protein